jgi:3-dehydroquinate synthase II
VTQRDRVAIAPTGDEAATRADIATRAVRRGFRHLVLPPLDAVPEGAGLRVDRFEGDRLVSETGGARTERRLVAVGSTQDLDEAITSGRRDGGVVVTWTRDRVIPLENLIAAGQGRFEILAWVERLSDVPAALGALEHGADRVIVRTRTVAELDRLEARLEDVTASPIAWELLPVRRVVPAGLGDRVIVDTTSLLGPAEGMLVGSAAAVLLHVTSEAVGSKFTRPRAFRVNAGAAHLYTLMADGSTRYLSELVAGDAVLVVEARGLPRIVRVGRIKIERRPLVMVEVERGSRTFTAFVQEAETVRLSGEAEAVATTDLVVSTRIYAASFPPARHLGDIVSEAIEER